MAEQSRRPALRHILASPHASSISLPVNDAVGERGLSRLLAPTTSFDDLFERAERLIEWSGEEAAYLNSHEVASFARQDVIGRDQYAYEALYELLPRLRRDAALLRGACGPGRLNEKAKSMTDLASQAVQAYVVHWESLRDGRTNGVVAS